MIIGAVASSLKAGILDKKKLLELNDDSLLHYVIDKTEKGLKTDDKTNLMVAKDLVNRFTKRYLYKTIYETEMKGKSSKLRIDDLSDWEKRYETERELEDVVGLEKGSILIYVPDESMGAKKYLRTRVELPIGWSATNIKFIEELNKSDFPKEYNEIYQVIKITKDMIIQKHEILWKLSVLVRDNIDEPAKSGIKQICEQWFSGAAPVSMVEFIGRGLGSTNVSFTEIAESINKSEAVPSGEKKSQLAMAVDATKANLSS
jgi:hypothetical protein